jgi:phage tail-like protein
MAASATQSPLQSTKGWPEPAVSVCFSVVIDGWNLGSFTGCQGLSFQVQVETREEGGTNGFVHQIPGRVTYTNIKLTRVVNKDSAMIQKWFASLQVPFKRTTAHIRALTTKGDEIAKWTLQGVIPVKWDGPSMSLDSAAVMTESLELAHHGFLPNA